MIAKDENYCVGTHLSYSCHNTIKSTVDIRHALEKIPHFFSPDVIIARILIIGFGKSERLMTAHGNQVIKKRILCRLKRAESKIENLVIRSTPAYLFEFHVEDLIECGESHFFECYSPVEIFTSVSVKYRNIETVLCKASGDGIGEVIVPYFHGWEVIKRLQAVYYREFTV